MAAGRTIAAQLRHAITDWRKIVIWCRGPDYCCALPLSASRLSKLIFKSPPTRPGTSFATQDFGVEANGVSAVWRKFFICGGRGGT